MRRRRPIPGGPLGTCGPSRAVTREGGRSRVVEDRYGHEDPEVKIILSVAPQHSILLLADVENDEAEVPLDGVEDAVVSSGSVVGINVMAEVDGETLVELTDEPYDPTDLVPLFDGPVDTPSRSVSLCTSDWSVLAALPVGDDETRVRIFGSTSTRPDRVLVMLS